MRFVRRYHPLVALLLLMPSAAILSGCDNTLDPYTENDLFYFSFYGYLDTADDVHWIRVVDLQEESGHRGDPQISVTLEHLESGERFEMQDSLFHFGGGRTARNFRAEAEILPESTYRLTAIREDGAQSNAIIETPSGFRDPELLQPRFMQDFDELTIFDVEHLADVQIRFNTIHKESGNVRPYTISLMDIVSPAGGNQHSALISRDLIPLAIRGLEDILVTDCRIHISKGGDGWVDFDSIDPRIIALPRGISNVEQGTGYVVGVKSRTIEYEHASCDDQED
ncbi:hypothetical protein QA596_07455 [Balneolales bacterium ANBcel1]|nr:hypothetical protein [Balneolales bacterium ANBcel1]